MNNNPIKCDVCGKFISYKELEGGECSRDFVPESEFTIEEFVFRCKKCTSANGNVKSTQLLKY